MAGGLREGSLFLLLPVFGAQEGAVVDRALFSVFEDTGLSPCCVHRAAGPQDRSSAGQQDRRFVVELQDRRFVVGQQDRDSRMTEVDRTGQ